MAESRGQESSPDPADIRFQNGHKGRIRFDKRVNQRDLYGDKEKRLIGKQVQERYQHGVYGLYKENLRCSRHIMDNFSAFHNHLGKMGEIRVQQHNLGNLAAGVWLASLPSATAMEQSASRSARKSLTPSPVIAT